MCCRIDSIQHKKVLVLLYKVCVKFWQLLFTCVREPNVRCTYWIFFALKIGSSLLHTTTYVIFCMNMIHEYLLDLILTCIYPRLFAQKFIHLWTLNPIHKVVRLEWGRICLTHVNICTFSMYNGVTNLMKLHFTFHYNF